MEKLNRRQALKMITEAAESCLHVRDSEAGLALLQKIITASQAFVVEHFEAHGEDELMFSSEVLGCVFAAICDHGGRS